LNFELSYKPFGAFAILIEWPSIIDEVIIQDIVAFEKEIENKESVLEAVIAYNSLLVRYHEPILNVSLKIQELQVLYDLKRPIQKQSQKLWEIPVCYDLSFGLDLKEISRQKKQPLEEIIALHSSVDYLIYFIGFQPGFLYLGGLHKKIHTPRKSNPRLRVDKGSLGIGGKQTGIYPQDSSGGWNIIGKSPVDFFTISNEQPCFAKPGDRIRFSPINLNTFYQIEKEVSNGTHILRSKLL